MSVPRRWLVHLLDEAFASEAPTTSLAAPPSFSSVTRARRQALAMSAARGLVFGAPQLRPTQVLSRDVEELFPVVRMLAVIGDVVDTAAATLGDAPRRRALAGALAVVYGEGSNVDDARVLAGDFGGSQKAQRALLGVERELARRRYLTGNPMLGLTLHHAWVAIDARAVVLVAVDLLAGVVVDGALVDRVQRELASARLATTAAIAGLSEWRELMDADEVRVASLWQVKNLGVAKDQTARLVEVVKRPPDLSRLLTLIPHEARARVFLHTALAAVVDGRVSPEERSYLTALGDLVGLSPAAQKRGRRRVLEFVKRHAEDFNPLAAAAGFAAVDPPLSVRLARIVFDNADALWREIRETGDLGVLLARRASGLSLNADEQRRMREQLVDVVKAVPSLAVFALPGGFVLLPLLLKLLPFDLRPSSFRDLDDFHAFARGDEDALSPKRVGEAKVVPPPRFFRR
jgi:tellurite resistance protein